MASGLEPIYTQRRCAAGAALIAKDRVRGMQPGLPLVREARVGDAAAIARVHVASWRSTYPGIVPTAYLVALDEATAAARWAVTLRHHGAGRGAFVAVDAGSGRVVGFSTCGPHRVPVEGYAGEFYALYLDEDWQGRGGGSWLMAAMAERLLAAGVRAGAVWVLSANPSRWFYERLGGQRIAERPIRFAGETLVEAAYGWRDLVPLARLATQRRGGASEG